MSEKERSNRCKTAGTAGASTLDSTPEQRLTCFRDILDLVLHMSDEEWKAVSRDMAKEVTRFEFAAASTKIVTMVSSAVVRRLLTSFSESFGTEAILEANDKLKNTCNSDAADSRSPTEASDVICRLAQRTVTEVKGAMLEAIQRTASRASRTARASTPAEDPLSQLEDLSITCTNEICDKILTLYHSEELNRPEGEKTSLTSHQEVHGIINSLEEVVSIHRSSSWCTVSSASDCTTTEVMAPDCASSAPQAERPFSIHFMNKASQVVSEVLLKTEQKIAASVSPHTSVSVSSETDLNFLTEMAKSTAMEILQNLFVLLVQSLREHLSGVSCSDADQPGAGQEQEFLSDAPKVHTDIREQEFTSVCKQKQVVSEESESLVKVCPETAELDISLKNIQEFAAAELFLEEATQVASDILVKRLSSDISIGLDSMKDSGSGTALLSASSVELDRVVSKILNQVIRGVAQELKVTDMENGSEARLDEAQVSDADDRSASHSKSSSDVSSNLQSLSELEGKESVHEFVDAERTPQAPVPKGPLVPMHLFTAVRNHLKGFFSSFSKSAAATKKTDASASSEIDENRVSPDASGDDSIQELAKTSGPAPDLSLNSQYFKKRKKKRSRAPLPHWDELTTPPAENPQSSSHTESNGSRDAEQDP